MMVVYLKGLYVKDSLSILAKKIRLQEFLRILTAGKINYLEHFADNIKVFLDGGGFDNSFTVGAVKTLPSKGDDAKNGEVKTKSPKHLTVSIHNDLLSSDREIKKQEKTFFADVSLANMYTHKLYSNPENSLGHWYNITNQSKKTWNGDELRGVLTCSSAISFGCIPNLPACLLTNFSQLLDDLEKIFVVY